VARADRGVTLTDGTVVTRELLTEESEEAAVYRNELPPNSREASLLEPARSLFTTLVYRERFTEFLTIPGYQVLG
jgi:hypothetical protein